MRRRLIVLSLATTVLVVVSFVLPLGLLVRRQAMESAMVRAERDAQSVAAVVALTAGVSSEPGSVAETLGALPPGTVVFLEDGTVVGEQAAGQGSLGPTAAASHRTVASFVDAGWEIALPVIGREGVTVVDSFVTDTDLTAGVGTAWLLLGGLAVVLIAVAVLVADRLGRRLTAPIEELARSAHQLAEGDLEARVEPVDPVELRETGEAFNYLAERLDHLLAEERESAADLSHRLRTPLTSLRLQAESLADGEERELMVGQVDRLEHAMNQVIELSRSRAARPPAECDLNRVVRERAAFWGVLADDQGRELIVELDGDLGLVPVSADELQVLVDTLVGNVFSHTPPGASFGIRTGREMSASWLEVADRGPGFDDPARLGRGISGRGSTGLGLDIVRKIAESAGGSLQIDDRPGGGAVVRVRFGRAQSESTSISTRT